MKTVRKAIYALLSLVLIIFLINSVFAITASIGNARMILRAKTGDIIEKTILVRNINDEPVRIQAKISGDLEKYITIKENNFTLVAGEEKDMPFTIKVAKEGTTETKINIQFSPLGKEGGVGLSSTIIVIAEKGNGTFDPNDVDIPVSDEDSNLTTIKNPVTGNATNISMKAVAISSTIILGVVFIILLVLAKKSTKKGLEKLNKEIDETKPKKSAQ
jgi:hypothetical protein